MQLFYSVFDFYFANFLQHPFVTGEYNEAQLALQTSVMVSVVVVVSYSLYCSKLFSSEILLPSGKF